MATAAPSTSFHLRSLYRSILRELPIRTPSQPPSPLRQRLHNIFSSPTTTSSSSQLETKTNPQLTRQIQQGEQFVQFAKAQRMYAMLLDRYNPGMGMDEEERIRLTARRVGMDLPADVVLEGEGEGGEGNGKGE
ncbi:hypothetical protein FQN54_005612 [Arachnomyces sp. PD_36]|nr:hypothetical protein FQN54_005612 [Arachnomyces sp. PD_36]